MPKHPAFTSELKLVLMPSKRPVPGHETEYAKMYDCWHEAWVKFRVDSGLDPVLPSDGLLLTDEVGAIFWRGQCVGLACFTFLDLQKPWGHDFGWFKGWTPGAMSGLEAISPQVTVCSLFTVHPNFTGKQQVTRWRDVIAYSCMLHLLSSESGVMAGALNLGRHVDGCMGEGVGATVLERAVPYPHAKGQDMMLVAYEKGKVWEAYRRSGGQQLAAHIWTKLTYLGNRPLVPLPEVAEEEEFKNAA